MNQMVWASGRNLKKSAPETGELCRTNDQGISLSNVTLWKRGKISQEACDLSSISVMAVWGGMLYFYRLFTPPLPKLMSQNWWNIAHALPWCLFIVLALTVLLSASAWPNLSYPTMEAPLPTCATSVTLCPGFCTALAPVSKLVFKNSQNLRRFSVLPGLRKHWGWSWKLMYSNLDSKVVDVVLVLSDLVIYLRKWVRGLAVWVASHPDTGESPRPADFAWQFHMQTLLQPD